MDATFVSNFFTVFLSKYLPHNIYVELKNSNEDLVYAKQEYNQSKNQLVRASGTTEKNKKPIGNFLIIHSSKKSDPSHGTTEPPIYVKTPDPEGDYYTLIKIIYGKPEYGKSTYTRPEGILISSDGSIIPAGANAQAPVQAPVQAQPVQAPVQEAPKSTYTLKNGEHVPSAEVRQAQIDATTKRKGSNVTGEIYNRVLANPLPWQPNQWIELGEEVRTANGDLILKNGNPFIEFWYINPTTKESEYTLPEGGVLRDLAVSSSIGQELEQLRNQYSARESSAVSTALQNARDAVSVAPSAKKDEVMAKQVAEAYKYSTHPQIKDEYVKMLTGVNSTPKRTAPAFLAAIQERQKGGGDLPRGPPGLGAALLKGPPGLGAALLRGPPRGPPGSSSPPGPPSPQASTKLNDAGMTQLKDLVGRIKAEPAYDIIDPTNPHPLFVCTNGTCSVDPKYKDSVLETVVAKTQTPSPAVSSAASSAKLTVDDFIQMKDILDRPSLIAFMKSTYKVDSDFNVDIQAVFPDITTVQIDAAVAQYAEKKVVKPKAEPVAQSPKKDKAPTAAQLKANEQKRAEAANVVRPFEHYTAKEETLLNDIEKVKLSIKELTSTLEGNKKALTEAAKKGLVQPRHVRAILDTQASIQNAETDLRGKENTPGLKEKIAFMAPVSPQKMKTNSYIVETDRKGREILYGHKKLPAGWSVMVDPVARTAVYTNGAKQMPPEGKALPFGWKIDIDGNTLVYKNEKGEIQQNIPSGGGRRTRKYRGTRRKNKNKNKNKKTKKHRR